MYIILQEGRGRHLYIMMYVILQEASPLKGLIIIATRPLVSSPFSYKYPGQLTNCILKFSMAKHVIENSDMSAYTNR